jgi:predicted RNase H-like HicB family nuclease
MINYIITQPITLPVITLPAMARRFDPGREGGFIVNFPGLAKGWSEGETRDQALAQADDLLDEMILENGAQRRCPPPVAAKDTARRGSPALTAARLVLRHSFK